MKIATTVSFIDANGSVFYRIHAFSPAAIGEVLHRTSMRPILRRARSIEWAMGNTGGAIAYHRTIRGAVGVDTQIYRVGGPPQPIV